MIFNGNDRWELKNLEVIRKSCVNYGLHVTYTIHKEDGDYEFDIPYLRLPVHYNGLCSISSTPSLMIDDEPFREQVHVDIGFGDLEAFPDKNGEYFIEKKL